LGQWYLIAIWKFPSSSLHVYMFGLKAVTTGENLNQIVARTLAKA
jgi:hypothetical protein